MIKPCLDCGEPTEQTRCADCRLPDSKPSAAARGYDYRWSKLSARARKLQPFCSDCYSTEDLTTDHSPTAWARKAAGKPIRLRDVDVVCRSCNGKRGRARPLAQTGGVAPSDTPSGPASQAGSRTNRRPA